MPDAPELDGDVAPWIEDYQVDDAAGVVAALDCPGAAEPSSARAANGTELPRGAVEPIEAWQQRDARHCGRLYTAQEYACLRSTTPHDRPPDGRIGPGDDAPHAKVLLVYREAYFAARGCRPIVSGLEHAAAKRLLSELPLDVALELIREVYAGRRARLWSLNDVSFEARRRAVERRGRA